MRSRLSSAQLGLGFGLSLAKRTGHHCFVFKVEIFTPDNAFCTSLLVCQAMHDHQSSCKISCQPGRSIAGVQCLIWYPTLSCRQNCPAGRSHVNQPASLPVLNIYSYLPASSTLIRTGECRDCDECGKTFKWEKSVTVHLADHRRRVKMNEFLPDSPQGQGKKKFQESASYAAY